MNFKRFLETLHFINLMQCNHFCSIFGFKWWLINGKAFNKRILLHSCSWFNIVIILIKNVNEWLFLLVIDLSLDVPSPFYYFLFIPKILLCLHLLIINLRDLVFDLVEWGGALSEFSVCGVFSIHQLKYTHLAFIFLIPSSTWHSCNLFKIIYGRLFLLRGYPLRVEIDADDLVVVVWVWATVHHVLMMSLIRHSHPLYQLLYILRPLYALLLWRRMNQVTLCNLGERVVLKDR